MLEDDCSHYMFYTALLLGYSMNSVDCKQFYTNSTTNYRVLESESDQIKLRRLWIPDIKECEQQHSVITLLQSIENVVSATLQMYKGHIQVQHKEKFTLEVADANRTE